MMVKFMNCVSIALLGIFYVVPASAVGRDGATVYQAECASCHDSGAARMPSFSALQGRATNHIVSALEMGTMRIVGLFNLSGPERIAVAEFITGKTHDPNWADTGDSSCARNDWVQQDLFSLPHWNGWGAGLGNTRFQKASYAGISAQDIPDLELKWAFAFPGETFVESQPTIVGARIFVGSPSGMVYSLDARTGCTYWTFQADAPIKAPVTIGPVGNNHHAAFFGDQRGRVYSVDAETGELRWKAIGDNHPSARVTGGLQVFGGRLYVPMASFEEAMAMDPNYDCCVFRGSVLAYDSKTGRLLWKRYTIGQKPTEVSRDTHGKPMWGPSGAAVWSAVTIDPEAGQFYVGTGDNYSNPPTDTSDGILAFDLESGKPSWVYQALAGDAWTVGCMVEPKINCPENEGPDSDMGASPILVKRVDGRKIIIGAQKNGVAHAVDPKENGKVLWTKKLAKGGIQGGLQWGQATDGENLYASKADTLWSSDSTISTDIELDPKAGGGLVAVDLKSGDILWEAAPVSCEGRVRCGPAQSAAVTAIEGAVFSGSHSGEMRAFDASTGRELWRYDSVREFETVNGARGYGGAIDQSGVVVVDGMVYFNSGYAKWGGNAGNVLLAFGLPEE